MSQTDSEPPISDGSQARRSIKWSVDQKLTSAEERLSRLEQGQKAQLEQGNRILQMLEEVPADENLDEPEPRSSQPNDPGQTPSEPQPTGLSPQAGQQTPLVLSPPPIPAPQPTQEELDQIQSLQHPDPPPIQQAPERKGIWKYL